ncbi:MAG TPA: prepilin peptidase, partial [Pasteurellaceae bacterium]|nr:prepilin peptidase [Pasteurellaceae bacterium]
GLKPIKCGHFLRYFFSFAVFFGSCFYAFTSLALATVFALYASLLCIISVIDWHYKLISPAMCQFLLSSGIIAAYGEITSISLEQSLQSALFGFTAFFIIYHLSKLYYRQEALGRGDYWLVAGLAAFIPWQMLPLMILIACLSALSYGLWLKYHKREIGYIPFAPFLTIGGIFTFLLNNASIV